jgi:5-methylcytosine-specific restriction endonuclease McrA
MAHLKAARYARERGASGFHSLEEWEALKAKHGQRCIGCGENKPLTRDHIIPLALGGSHDIENIQPLCRNCNSRKWMKLNIYENPELLNSKTP